MRGGLVSFHLGSPGACRWTGGVPSRGARGARGPDRSAGRVGAGPAGAGRGRPVGGASGPNQRRGSHSRDSSAGWAGEALSRRVSCLLWSLCPQVPQSLAQEQGLRPQGLQAGEDSRPPLFLADLGLADQTVTGRHDGSWLVPRLGGRGAGLSFARSRDRRRQRARMDQPGARRGLSAPSWSGWAGWGPSWLLRAAHHLLGCTLNCRALGSLAVSGKVGLGRGLLRFRKLTPGTVSQGPTCPSCPTSLLEHLPVSRYGNTSGCLVGGGCGGHPVDGALGRLTTHSPVLGLQHHRPRLCSPSSPTCLPCPLTRRVQGRVPHPSPPCRREGVAWPMRPRSLRGH